MINIYWYILGAVIAIVLIILIIAIILSELRTTTAV